MKNVFLCVKLKVFISYYEYKISWAMLSGGNIKFLQRRWRYVAIDPWNGINVINITWGRAAIQKRRRKNVVWAVFTILSSDNDDEKKIKHQRSCNWCLWDQQQKPEKHLHVIVKTEPLFVSHYRNRLLNGHWFRVIFIIIIKRLFNVVRTA